MDNDTSGFGLDDLDRLAERAVDSVLTLVRRGTALAGGVLGCAGAAALGGFVAGVAALSGGLEKVWMLLAATFAAISIGAVLVAIVRLRAVRKGATMLLAEVRDLISGNANSHRTVAATVESHDDIQGESVIVMSRQFMGLRNEIGGRIGQFRTLATAMSAVTTFPLLIALSAVITVVFTGLGLIFVMSLAL